MRLRPPVFGLRIPHPPPLPRQVTTQQGEQLASEYGMRFLETSARSDVNVREAFTAIAEDVVDRLLASGGDLSGGGGLSVNAPAADAKKGCC